MVMEKLQEGIQGLLRDFKLQYSTLTNDNVVMTHMPDHVKDNHANTTQGYSFLSKSLFYEKRHSVFCYLVQYYNLAIMDSKGCIGWNVPGIKELLRRTLCVWEPLYHLLYIMTHISCCGTQFIDNQVCNADRHHNLFMGGNEMFILTRYSKKTGIMPSNDKVNSSRRMGMAELDVLDQPKFSSISPIINCKGKQKASITHQPQPISAVVDHAKSQSSLASKSSPAPVRRQTYRNCKRALEHVSETRGEEEEKSSRSLECLHRVWTSVKMKDIEVISLSSGDHDEDNDNDNDDNDNDSSISFIVPDSSRASLPPPAVREIREDI
jgi:hypothetical protein